MKKDKLNVLLYKAHLHAALEWGNLWHLIQDSILNSINIEFVDVYKTLYRKLSQLTQNPTETTRSKRKFLQRVTNLTSISFTDEEISMLNEGLKYNLGHKQKNWIQNLSLEAECAITLLRQEEQEYMRHRVAKQKDKIYTQLPTLSTYTPKQARESRTVRSIKEKLCTNKAILTNADKGNSIVILYLNNYEEKVSDFIHKNGALETKNNTTVKFQKELKHTLKHCKILVNPEEKWRLTNLNPQTPHLKGLVKIHKDGMPIHLVVDYSQAPAYKLAKKLTNILETYIPLPSAFNIQNSAQLMKEISEIPFVPGLHLVSLDISDMYSNIPTDELEHIIRVLCKQRDIEVTLMLEIMAITKTVLTQNYYGFKGKTYLQPKGLAMGAPSSSILSEMYLQHLENTKALSILTKPGIEGYFRYVDDILLVYNRNLIDIGGVLASFNGLTPSLKFTLEQEVDNKLNFLDLTLVKTDINISFNIYRKPTTTDTINPMDSCNPHEHKLAAIRYFLNRANTYDLNTISKQAEMDTIKHILRNNMYEVSILNSLNRKKPNPKQELDHPRQKWVRLTYIGRETRLVTKLFRHTQVKIAYTTNNNLEEFLRYNVTRETNKYERSGIYQLNCPTCDRKYIGQTGIPFHARFREHQHDYKYMCRKSKFAQHLLEDGHTFGPLENIMDVVQYARKGKMMDALERFHIYELTQRGTQINDKLTVQNNPIFDVIVRHLQRRGNR